MVPLADPFPWDWHDDPGSTVGVVLYRAQLQAGDTALAQQLNQALRERGLRPRLIWVSSLREQIVERCDEIRVSISSDLNKDCACHQRADAMRKVCAIGPTS